MNNFTPQKSSLEIVNRFCIDPQTRRNLPEFIHFCSRYTTAYLRVLRRSGYPLPIEDGDLEKSLRDISTGLVASLFQSKPGRPFYPIFDFYLRYGISDFETATSECLYDRLTILLRGNAKRELFRRRRAENAPLENLKVNIKNALAKEEYSMTNSTIALGSVYLKAQEKSLRLDNPYIDPAALYDLVLHAYHKEGAPNAPTWLRAIFNELSQSTDVRNTLATKELLPAIIAVWASARDEYSLNQPKSNSGLEQMISEIIKAEIPAVIMWAEKSLLAASLGKGKLEQSDVPDYLAALEERLLDFASGFNDIARPKYLYAMRPSLTTKEYRKRHIYLFETMIAKSLEHLQEILQKNPTIRSLWDYLH